jgi:6-phosphogluconolactonase
VLYETSLRRVVPAREGSLPVLDLVHLGMGNNGHTASLFPRSPVLHVTDRLVAAPFIEELGKSRITMTVPLLNAARLQMFLVTGASKAGVLREVLADAGDSDRLPARLMQPVDGIQLWLVDQAAAEQVS